MRDEVKGRLRLGTRGSELALWQARETERRIEEPLEIVVVKTEGDRRRDIALQGQSTTGFFTKDIERRLINREIDIAVHSLKDLPTQGDPALTIAAYLPRATVEDLLLVHPEWTDDEGWLPLKAGCVVGAGSLRRQSLIRRWAPTARPELIRGNVPTRVRKCIDGEYGAVVLARAGVERLGLDPRPLRGWQLDDTRWLPAPGQGAVAVQIRADDDHARCAVTAIDDDATRQAVGLERHLLTAFEGGCHTAFGAHATAKADSWTLDIGIDRGDAGWGQLRIEGSLGDCRAIGLDSLPQFEVPEAAEWSQLRSLWSPPGADGPR